MGRKKKQEVTQQNGNGSAPTLAGAIQSALQTIGVEAETGKVREWVRQNCPGVNVGAASFQSTLSVKRKALRGSAAPGKKRRRAARSASEPTLTDLMRVKRAAESQGGVESLLKTVQSVRGLADQVGGIDGLERCLEALQGFAGAR
jgi:hypothetical protein